MGTHKTFYILYVSMLYKMIILLGFQDKEKQNIQNLTVLLAHFLVIFQVYHSVLVLTK